MGTMTNFYIKKENYKIKKKKLGKTLYGSWIW